MKMHLKFHTNISFGDEVLDYKTTSTLPDPTGHVHEYTGVLNKDVEKFIKRSNLYFGDAAPVLESTAHAEYKYSGSTNDYAKSQSDINTMKKELRASNFSFGNDSHDWTTDYQRGYVPYTSEQQAKGRGSMAKEVSADLRKCHFDFGHDTHDWTTDMSRTQAAAKLAQEKDRGGRDPKKDREQAKALKLQLQRTSFVIGDDERYM